jgi:outer membrane beta-barrel protein
LATSGPAFADSKKDKKKDKKDKPADTKKDQKDTTTPPKPDEPQPEIEIDINPNEPTTPTTPPGVTDSISDSGSSEATVKAEKDKDIKLGETLASWQDVVVVMRKPFLKMNRLELIPSWGVTLNDNMIRHIEFNGMVNYWLTDVLAVGVEGQIFAHTFLEPYDLVARDYRRLPTLNQYNFGAALDFHYTPIYAKFAVLNKFIVHWETMFTAGVGFVQSQVLPRDPALPGWNNFLISPNIGVTARVFITDFITLNLAVKDYIFVDKYESTMRMTADVEDAKRNATSQLINNIMFSVGLSFWVPPVFHYTTFR